MSQKKKFEEHEGKFRELILYVSQKCASAQMFGSTKLNKILYFSDFITYAKTGKPITGFDYQNLAYGPAPRRLVPVRRKMESDGELGQQEVRLPSGTAQIRPVNLRAPNLDMFTAEEIATVDSVIEALWDRPAEECSDLSHKMVGWQITEVGESIPYSTIFLSNRPLAEPEIMRGKKLAAEYSIHCAT